MKKILIICTVFLSLNALPVYAQDTANITFPDVSTDHPNYTAIEYFRDKDVIEGYPDGTFRPDQEANRAEALKIILLGSNVEVEEVFLGLNVFPDVSGSDWFYPYIKKAKEMEIIQGYDDGYFKPAQVQNIAETLKIIFLTSNVQMPEVPPNTTIYPDVTDELWFAPYAVYAKEKNIIEPQNDGTMNAGRGVTRGELVEIMYRMDIVMKNGGKPFDISTNWPIEKFSQYAFQAKKPFTWRVLYNEEEIVFWRPDEINHQSSYEVPFPNSASVIFHLDNNEDGLSQSAYEENLEFVYRTDFGSYQKNTLTIAGYPALNLNVSLVHDDYFVFYPQGKVLQIYISYGWGDLTDQLIKEIEGIIDNVNYVTPQDVTSGDVLSEARNRILVEGLGQETLDLFSDLVNIETDTIGVGTGPIDYFYSAQYDVTIKYERESDTILDIQNEQTTAF